MEDIRAAILCPGPSLARLNTGDLSSYDIAIAVNEAAEHEAYIEFDRGSRYWVALDAPAFYKTDRSGHGEQGEERRPIIYCSLSAQRRMSREQPEARERYRFITSEEVVGTQAPCPIDKSIKWGIYSLTHGMVFAALHGKANEIDIFGCDWQGTANWNGKENERQRRARGAERWKREREIFDRTVKALEAIGARSVRRILDPADSARPCGRGDDDARLNADRGRPGDGDADAPARALAAAGTSGEEGGGQ